MQYTTKRFFFFNQKFRLLMCTFRPRTFFAVLVPNGQALYNARCFH